MSNRTKNPFTMNHKILFSLPLTLLTLWLFAGCTSVKPFSGCDNFILTFQLQDAEGKVYPATIVQDNVTVEVPANIPLSTLTATYSLSELATIAPNPTDVESWEEEQTFVVTSKCGQQREYKVHVATRDVEVQSSFHLKTNADVAQFATLRIDKIIGNLILGEPNSPDTITSLEGLRGLKTVQYELVIHGNVAASLEPLQSLDQVGALKMREKNKEVKEIHFPLLKSLPRGLSILSDSLRVINMPEVREIGEINLEGTHFTTLQIPKVEAIYGDVFLKASKLSAFEAPQLKRAENFNFKKNDWNSPLLITQFICPQLTRLGKLEMEDPIKLQKVSLSLLQKASLISFPTVQSLQELDLSSLQEIETLTISTAYGGKEVNQIMTELNFPRLSKVSALKFERQPFAKLTTLRIPQLSEVEILALPAGLTTIEAPKLERVTKELIVQDYVPALFNSLKDVQKLSMDMADFKERIEHIDLSVVPKLHNLTIKPNEIGKITFPKIVSGEVVLSYNSRNVPQAPVLLGLEECGNFSVQYALNFPSLELPPTLVKVNGDVIFSNTIKEITATGLQEITGKLDISSANSKKINFPELKVVGTECNLRSKEIKEVHLPKLQKVQKLLIGGRGAWQKNTTLTNLDFLSPLQELKTLEISYCYELYDYTGIKHLVESGQINEKNWNSKAVNNNLYTPSFQDLQAGRYKPSFSTP